MFFCREGNKSKYANEIIQYFPNHKTYIEGFVGIGGIFFNKPLAKYNILNDSSEFIFKIYEILKDEAKIEAMIKEIEFTPNYFDYIKKNTEEPLRSILMSAYGMYGRENAIQSLGTKNKKQNLIERVISLKYHFLHYTNNTMVTNKDIFKFLISIEYSNKEDTFIYLDPPYSISKGALKDNKGWSIEKLEELIDLLISLDVKFAISEFNDEKIIELFLKKGLNYKIIAKSKFSKTIDKYEILAMNYDVDAMQPSLL